MAYLILAPMTLTPRWNHGGDVAYLRIFASESFYELTSGEYIAQGQVDNASSFYQQYTCTINGTELTIPQVIIPTTTDSSSPTATFTFKIYDSQGVPRYTMLSQAYVDPEFFQVVPESSVNVTAAGTSTVNGIYTYRGLNNGKPYYNLDGSNTSTTLAAIVWSGSAWNMLSSGGVTRYTSSSTLDYPWEGTWGVATASAPAPTVAENATIVASTWENFTISNQGSMPWPQPWNAYWTIPQTQQYINGLIGDGTTPYASKVVAGKTQLSEYPAVASVPIALGVNDAVWQGINESVYLDSYAYTSAGLTDALNAIGHSTPTQLILTQPCTITTNETITPNVLITLQGSGGFVVDGGVTLTISAMTPPPKIQVFSGAGNVVFAKNATGGEFHLEWWAGIAPVTDVDHAFEQAGTSLTTGIGGILHIGAGVWEVTNWEIPNRSTIQGVGSGVDNTAATIIQVGSLIPSVDKRAPFRARDAFRYISVKDLTLSTSTATDKYCFIASGSVPDSALGLYFDNVTFYGSGTASPAQFYAWDEDDAHAWECIGVQFNNCQWMTPTNGKSVHWDTVNSSVTFTNRQTNNATGSTFFYGDYVGWVQDNLPDNRGVAGLTPTATLDRTIAATISSGTKAATVTTGTVSLNDVGQQVIFGGTFTTTITGITDATHFTVTDNAPSTFTAQTLAVYRYTPDSDGAYAVWHLVNSRGTIDLNTTVDEGYQYFLVNDASDNLSPVNINGGIIQSQIQLNAAMVLNINGCRMRSQTLEDITGITATVNMPVPNSMSSQNIWGVILLEPQLWGVNDGTSRVQMNMNYGYNATSFTPTYRQSFEVPTWFKQTITNAGNLTTPLAMFAAADVTFSPTANKRLFGWGRLEATSEILDYYYWVERDYDTGFTLFVGNQAAPNRGYDFDSNVYATCFTGDVATATTGTTEANYDPGDSSMFFRLDPSVATSSISGLGLTATSLFTALSGAVHQIWNVDSGSNKIVLQHQNAGSSAANRFICDTGADITLSPNEGATLWYDGTTQRWRVSKLNITGLTSNGTTVTSSLATTISGALTASSTATIASTTTIGSSGFRFILTPAGGGTGAAVMGNTSSGEFIRQNESAQTLELSSNAISITGTTGLTGALTGTAAIKSTSKTAGIGYATGAGSTVVQSTSRTTGVTINGATGAMSGTVTLFAAAPSTTPTKFTVTNAAVALNDVVLVSVQSANAANSYVVSVTAVGSGSFQLAVYSQSGTTSDSPVINFAVIKAVAS